jgi:hypothetical protein
MQTTARPTVQVSYLNGRQFRRVTWHAEGVTLIFAVGRHVRPGVFRGHLMARIVRPVPVADVPAQTHGAFYWIGQPTAHTVKDVHGQIMARIVRPVPIADVPARLSGHGAFAAESEF